MINHLCETASKIAGPKQLNNVRSQLFNQLDMYKLESFNVVEVTSDNESSLKALTNEPVREGVRVKIHAPGRYGVPKLDRNIRLIIERCRCIINTLPDDLPSLLIPWCVKFVVSRLNLIRRGFHW
jgi:hypothetical protein